MNMILAEILRLAKLKDPIDRQAQAKFDAQNNALIPEMAVLTDRIKSIHAQNQSQIHLIRRYTQRIKNFCDQMTHQVNMAEEELLKKLGPRNRN